MPKLRSSRRAPVLKDSDYDHEIRLVNQDRTASSPPLSAETTDIVRSSTGSALLPPPDRSPSPHEQDEAADISVQPADREVTPDTHATRGTGPSIEVEEPTPFDRTGSVHCPHRTKAPQLERESAIDILFENERGGFLCGIALFSSKALGNLDPPAWTNAYHKSSPSNIFNAQVPDPSWEWLWPEWRVNHDEGVGEDGWRYSFMFSKKFSWHGPRWWNSFVRRRAWIRKRVKKATDDISADPHMLNTNYFTVRPASEVSHSRTGSRASRVGSHISKGSISQLSRSDTAGLEDDIEIEDTHMLLRALRRCRIDREKLEAFDSYLEHAEDLVGLPDSMHDIMAIFMFQDSRQLLLVRLRRLFDDTVEALGKESTDRLRNRKEHLAAAISQAEEQVRKLAYWSDAKAMAEAGDGVQGAGGGTLGNGFQGQGLNGSEPSGPDKGKTP